MKTFLFILFFCGAFAVQSQTTFTQGYLLVDKKVSIFVDVQFTLNQVDSTILLPTGETKIDSFNIVDFNKGKEGMKPDMGLVMYLHIGSVAKYYFSDYYGEVFTITYKNGRLVLWTKQQKGFEIDTN